MLDFDKSFFDGEVRSGYYVSTIAKHNWAAILEVYAEIDRVCRKYSIPYFLDCGTLIGAVRHGGFIPWDDDFDITMKREDYKRFLQIAPLEFNYFEKRDDVPDRDGRMFFHSIYNASNEYYVQGMIMSSRSLQLDEQYLRRFHGSPFVASIDIFPSDYFPGENDETNEVLKLMRLLNSMVYSDVYWGMAGREIENATHDKVINIGNMVGYKFDPDKNFRMQAAKLIDILASLYSSEECDYIQKIICHLGSDHINLCKKEWYDSAVYLPFEILEMPCPSAYNKVLMTHYGSYMTPVEWGGHGSQQLARLKEQPEFANMNVEEYLEDIMKNYN